MITINLLPVELRPIKRTPLPYIVCVGLLMAALLFCFKTYVQDVGALNDIKAELSKNQGELSSLQDSVNRYNELAEEKKLLQTQLETIYEIVNDRIIWSRQLHNLTRLSADKNMWFNEIDVKQIPYTESVDVYDPKTKKSTVKKIRKSRPMLSLNGFVTSGTDGRATVSLFMDAAENDEEFSSQFKLESLALGDTEFEDTIVREFTIDYSILTGAESQ